MSAARRAGVFRRLIEWRRHRVAERLDAGRIRPHHDAARAAVHAPGLNTQRSFEMSWMWTQTTRDEMLEGVDRSCQLGSHHRSLRQRSASAKLIAGISRASKRNAHSDPIQPDARRPRRRHKFALPPGGEHDLLLRVLGLLPLAEHQSAILLQSAPVAVKQDAKRPRVAPARSVQQDGFVRTIVDAGARRSFTWSNGVPLRTSSVTRHTRAAPTPTARARLGERLVAVAAGHDAEAPTAAPATPDPAGTEPPSGPPRMRLTSLRSADSPPAVALCAGKSPGAPFSSASGNHRCCPSGDRLGGLGIAQLVRLQARGCRIHPAKRRRRVPATRALRVRCAAHRRGTS